MRQKGFAPIIILIIISALVGVGIIASQGQIKKYTEQKNEDGSENKSFFNVTTPSPPAPTPIPVGILKGKLTGGYYSKSVENAKVSLNEQINSTTNSNGEFSITNIPIGTYTITFSHPEYSFNSFQVTINEGDNTLNNNIHGNLTNPKPTQATGVCFIDSNNNAIKDNGENGLDGSANIYFYESNKWVSQKYFKCDINGNYNETLSKIGKYKIEPGVYTFYGQPQAKELVVDGYGGTKAFNFGYLPLKVQSGFTVYVFNDKNENNSRDGDEENIHYQYVRITNLSGKITEPLGNSYNLAVPAEGASNNQFNPGNYKFELIPETSSWSNYFRVTKGQETITFSTNTPHQTIYLGAHKLY